MNLSMLEETLNLSSGPQPKKSKVMFKPKNDEKVWNFIAENCQNYGPFEIFNKMKESLGFEQAARSLYYRFRNTLAPNLHLTNFDVDTKLQIAKKFNLTLNKEYAKELGQYMDLELDPNGYILFYTWKNGYSSSSVNVATTSSATEMLMDLASSSEPISLKFEPNSNTESSGRNCDDCEASEQNQPWPEDPYLSQIDPFFANLKETITSSNREFVDEIKATNTALMTDLAKLLSESVQNKAKKANTSANPNSGLQHYLDGLKDLLNHLNRSELQDIEKRIQALEESLGDQDKVVPIDSVHSMLDIGLKLIGG